MNEPDTESVRIDITGIFDGYRVWVDGVPYGDFKNIAKAYALTKILELRAVEANAMLAATLAGASA